LVKHKDDKYIDIHSILFLYCKGVIKNIETSMIQGERSTKSKIQIIVKRNPGVKELLEKIAQENASETDYERALRKQDERDNHKDD